MEKKDLSKCTILDACCGSKMFWFDKDRQDVCFMDVRECELTLCDGRMMIVEPDVAADFREMPFEDDTFSMVVFDPPHLVNVGSTSWMAKKYGKLDKKTWKDDLKRGFSECFRVLKQGGFLVFKWNERDIPLSQIIKLSSVSPLFGQKTHGKGTHWVVFMKEMETCND